MIYDNSILSVPKIPSFNTIRLIDPDSKLTINILDILVTW